VSDFAGKFGEVSNLEIRRSRRKSTNIKPSALADWHQSTGYHTSTKRKQETKQSNFSEYTPEERMKMGRYIAENVPSKVTIHFSLLLDGKLTCRFNTL